MQTFQAIERRAIKLPVVFSLCLSDLTQLCVGVWGWCWWEQGDRGVALRQTRACCWLPGMLMGVDVILHPVVSNKKNSSGTLTVWPSGHWGCHRVLLLIFSSQYRWWEMRHLWVIPGACDQDGPPGSPRLHSGKSSVWWQLSCVHMGHRDTHCWVYLNH